MRPFSLLSVISLALASCGEPPKAGVRDAWVRLPAVAGNPGAAYFTLSGGPADATLTEVASPQAIRAEMHDNVSEGGMMKMTPITAGLAVPKGSEVKFAPGGKHVMLFDINPAVKPGTKMTLVFTYADGTKIEAQADAKAADEGGGAHDSH